MSRDLDALATQVVLIVKAALAPVQADVAAQKDKLGTVDAIRDRLVVLETKAAAPLPVVPDPVDLTPVLERMAAAEARLSVIGDVRDRVVAVETKALQPLLALPPDAGIDDLRERLKSLETRSEGPSPTDMAVVDLRKELSDIKAELRFEVRENATLRERVAVLESRPPVAGPKGDPGEPGKDGAAGKDGTAGLSFEGVYQEGKSYDPGNLVTWGGSSWHCNEATMTKPGDGSRAWTLMVKRGRDGRDGKDGAAPLPVVSVGARP